MSPAEIENTLLWHLDLLLPKHSVRDVYQYATLPGGKLFRPSLVWAILADINPALLLNSKSDKLSSHALLASAVEFHHSYTLIHDDLPCMDDDQVRRGKPCTHLVYGEWQALLAGDGLLNISYQLLTKSRNPRTLEVLRFFSWALGPKGLIHGQVLDLSHEMTLSLENTIRTHQLKTARLIQVSILASAILASEKNYKLEKKLWKFSELLGINFQLIDDLSELSETKLSEHEIDVNPWLHDSEKTLNELIKLLTRFNKLSNELNLPNTKIIIKNYYEKMLDIIVVNQETIEKHLGKKDYLFPVISLMKTFS